LGFEFCVVITSKLYFKATVNKFEDLEVWQLSRKYADKIHKLTLQNAFNLR
jgi:hypothetical protein